MSSVASSYLPVGDDLQQDAAHLLSHCIGARVFHTSIDASDDVEAPLRASIPSRCSLVTTNGDGACAIHSVWGQPDNINRLTCADARAFAARSLGSSLEYLCANIPLEFREDVRDKLASGLWSELMVGYFEGKRTAEIMAFKKHLDPQLFREAQACFHRRVNLTQEIRGSHPRVTG
jgi:hypothetical protein